MPARSPSWEPDSARRSLAARLGIEALDPSEAAALSADVVLECSGATSAARAAMAAARRGGRVVMLSVTTAETIVSLRDLVWGEREVMGSLSHVYDEDLPAALELLRNGTVRAAPLVETTDDLALALLRLTGQRASSPDAVKLVVHPSTD